MKGYTGILKNDPLFQGIPIEQCWQELIEYPDYYHNRRIKTKRKDLPPALHKQQSLSLA